MQHAWMLLVLGMTACCETRVSVYLSVTRLVCLSGWLAGWLAVCLSGCLAVALSVGICKDPKSRVLH
jgi:hypothetical protein